MYRAYLSLIFLLGSFSTVRLSYSHRSRVSTRACHARAKQVVHASSNFKALCPPRQLLQLGRRFPGSASSATARGHVVTSPEVGDDSVVGRRHHRPSVLVSQPRFFRLIEKLAALLLQAMLAWMDWMDRPAAKLAVAPSAQCACIGNAASASAPSVNRRRKVWPAGER